MTRYARPLRQLEHLFRLKPLAMPFRSCGSQCDRDCFVAALLAMTWGAGGGGGRDESVRRGQPCAGPAEQWFWVCDAVRAGRWSRVACAVRVVAILRVMPPALACAGSTGDLRAAEGRAARPGVRRSGSP